MQNNGFNRQTRGVNGKRAVMGNTFEHLLATGGYATALSGGIANTFHTFVVGHYDVAPSGGSMVLFSTGRSASNTPRATMGEAASNAYAVSRINDANTSAFGAGGSADFLVPHIFETEYDGVSMITRIDGVQVASVASSGAMTQDQATILGLKRTTIGSRAIASVAQIVTYSTNLDSSNAAQVRSYLNYKYDIRPQKAMNVVLEGASLTNPARGELTWANAMLYGCDKPTVTNLATTGATITTQMLGRVATFDAAYNGALAAGHNIAIISNEANGLQLDGSGDLAQEQASTVTWISGRKAVGFTTVILTMTPHGQSAGVGPSANYTTKSNAFNAWLRAGGSGADHVLDIAAVWPGGPDTNLELYDTDWIHYGFQGARVRAGLTETLYRQLSAAAP
jgi:hypothetical protein